MIHPSAIVHPDARLDSNVSVGPFSIVGPRVEIGEGTAIGSHVILEGRLRIGRHNRVFSHAYLGGEPQDKKYSGEETAVEIGDHNTIREYVTINRGTSQEAGVTRLGNHNWIMAYVHFAHDCQIGDRTIFANACQLAGHVHVGDWAILGASTLVHQFVHIGVHSFTGMGTYLPRDLPPYVKAAGNMAKPFGINGEGLRRRAFSAETVLELKRAYRVLYRSQLGLGAALSALREQASRVPEIAILVEFLERSTRGVIR